MPPKRKSYKRGYKRRRYGGKRYSTPAVAYAAQILDRAARYNRAVTNWQSLSPYLNTGNQFNAFGGQSLQDVINQKYLMYGKGGYFRNLARRAGGAIASSMGGSRRTGRAVGGLLYGAANHFAGGGGYVAAGSGEYDAAEGPPTNSLVSGSNVSVPTMQGGDEIGSICVTHREYLGNITGSVLFENSAFELNPGLVSTFPWLSQIAQNYEEYSFEQLMFTYTSLLSESTSSGVIGSIIMTTNYNAGQPDFTNTSDMLNNIGTISARPIDGPIIHGIECDDSKNVLSSYFVRAGSVPEGQDIKTYDVGRFQVATEGMPVNDQLQGQLWVSYQITLRKPKIYTAAGKGLLNDFYKLASGSAVSNDYFIGRALVASPMNNIGTIVSCPFPYTIQVNFPQTTVQGYFKIKMTWLNPSDGSGFPNQPKMAPRFQYSNTAVADPQFRARYVADPENLGSNVVFQTGTYQTAPGSTLEWEPQVMLEVVVKLLGSFAIPTYVRIDFPNFTGTWSATQCQVEVEQVNPNVTATTFNSPVGWIPVVTPQ